MLRTCSNDATFVLPRRQTSPPPRSPLALATLPRAKMALPAGCPSLLGANRRVFRETIPSGVPTSRLTGTPVGCRHRTAGLRRTLYQAGR